MNDITIDRSRFDELVELHCLLELLDIDSDFSFWASRPELLARQAIPLMHSVDPESWRKYLRDEKGLPGDMAQFVKDSLELAEIDGIKKATPFDWLAWGREHGLHENTLKPDYVNIASEVCLWGLFENAVICTPAIAAKEMGNEGASKGSALCGGDHDIASFFDPVSIEALASMFPCKGANGGSRWRGWHNNSKDSGLSVARQGKPGMYNPYIAAKWLLDNKKTELKPEHVMRKLANNLPARNMEEGRRLLVWDE